MKSKLIKTTLLLSSMLTMMAAAIMSPALPQINAQFADVPQADILTRLIITLPALFIAIFSPLFGWLIDKFGRKPFLLVSLLLYAFSGASGYILNDLYSILIGRAILGFAIAGIMTTATTLIGDYLKGEERNHFMGVQGAFIGLGGVVYISFAGFLADINWQLPFLIYLFALPVLFLAVKKIQEPKRSDEQARTTLTKIEYPKHTAFFVLFLSFFGTLFFYMLPVQIPYLLEEMPNVNNSMVGLAISSSTFSSAVVSLNLNRVRQIASFPVIYIAAFIFIGIGYVILAQASGYYQAIVGLVFGGIGLGLYLPSGNLWMMEIAPAQIRGRLIGKVSTSTFLAMFLSPIALLPAVNMLNIDGAFAMASVILFGTAIAIFTGTFLYKRKNVLKGQTAS